jgi:transketolase
MSQDVAKGAHSNREAFGEALVEMADEGLKFWVVDCDIAGGTGVWQFRDKYPDRFIQAGIAEQNAITLSAGLADSTGEPVFMTTFAAFMMRGYEQAILSIFYNRANVKLVASHPGLEVGPDGASAQCLWDLGAWRSVPESVVIVPADPRETKLATRAIMDYDGPVYMRTGRSEWPDVTTNPFELGQITNAYTPASAIHGSADIAIFACGPLYGISIEAANLLNRQGQSVSVVNLSTLKPIDPLIVRDWTSEAKLIITAEDHNVAGGLFSTVSEIVAQFPTNAPVVPVGVSDTFGQSGETDQLYSAYGLTAEEIASVAFARLAIA